MHLDRTLGFETPNFQSEVICRSGRANLTDRLSKLMVRNPEAFVEGSDMYISMKSRC